MNLFREMGGDAFYLGEGRGGAGNTVIKIDPLDHVREMGFISHGTMS